MTLSSSVSSTVCVCGYIQVMELYDSSWDEITSDSVNDCDGDDCYYGHVVTNALNCTHSLKETVWILYFVSLIIDHATSGPLWFF